LKVVTREALIAEVTVPGTIHEGAQLGPLQVRHTAHGVKFSVTVHNTGNVLLSLGGEVRTGRLTSSSRSFALGPAGIYVIPGGTATLSGRWPHPPLLAHDHFQALVTLHVFDRPDTTLLSSVVGIWFVAGWLIAVIVAAVAVMLLAVLTRRRWWRWISKRTEERRAVRTFKKSRRAARERSA
jgi:hypothetical protein